MEVRKEKVIETGKNMGAILLAGGLLIAIVVGGMVGISKYKAKVESANQAIQEEIQGQVAPIPEAVEETTDE